MIQLTGLILCAVAIISEPPTDEIIFNKSFGGDGTETGNAILQLDDKGFLIVGFTSSNSAGGFDVYVVRTDSNGIERWSKTYGGEKDDFGWDIAKASNGEFIITGWTLSEGNGGEDVFLLRIDDAGNLKWKKTLGSAKDEKSWAIKPTADGGYVIAAQTNNTNNGQWDLLLLKVDADGKEVWSKTHGGEGVDRVFAMAPAPDDSFVFAGIKSSKPDTPTNAYMICINGKGEILWEQEYGGAQKDVGHGVLTVGDEGFLLTGYGKSFAQHENDIYLIRTNIDGEELWKRVIGGPGDDRAMMSVQRSDGGFTTIGYSNSYGSGDFKAYIVHTDADINVIDTLAFGTPDNDRGVVMIECADGSLVLTGAFGAAEHKRTSIPFIKLRTPKKRKEKANH